MEPAPATSTENVEIADGAQPLVDAWAESLGGRDAIGKLGTVHMTGDCTIQGRACTFESFASPNGEVRFDLAFVDGGGFASAFDGAIAWHRDGDVVTEGAGADLETVRRSAFTSSFSMFFQDRLRGSITRDGASSIAILPRDVTTPMIVRFRSDGLPVSAESPGFRVVFGGWTEYLGVQTASTWTSGPNGTENTFRLASIDDAQGSYAKPQ